MRKRGIKDPANRGGMRDAGEDRCAVEEYAIRLDMESFARLLAIYHRPKQIFFSPAAKYVRRNADLDMLITSIFRAQGPRRVSAQPRRIYTSRAHPFAFRAYLIRRNDNRA